jgi:hypothetical protein
MGTILNPVVTDMYFLIIHINPSGTIENSITEYDVVSTAAGKDYAPTI